MTAMDDRAIPETVRLYGIPTLPQLTDDSGDLAAGPGPLPELLQLTVAMEPSRVILAAAALAQELGWAALLTLDGDAADDPANLRLLLHAATASWPAIVSGTRNGGTEPSGAALSRFLVRLACGESLPDTGSGCRLYPVQFLTSRRFTTMATGFPVETLVRGAWAGLPLLTVPLAKEDRRTPSMDRVGRSAGDTLGLVLLHGRLLLRALLPWPHRRLVPKSPGIHPLRLLTRPLDTFRLLCREHASATELAAAAWMGIFIGALPIIPFGIITIVYVHHKLHLNKLAGVVASNVCVFPFVPLLCVEVGHFLRFGRIWSEFNQQTLLYELHHRLWEWLLGALLVGPLIGFAGALLTYLLVRRLRSAPGTA
jgi:uncharacterized protein (DUF2062 family)